MSRQLNVKSGSSEMERRLGHITAMGVTSPSTRTGPADGKAGERGLTSWEETLPPPGLATLSFRAC